MNYLLDTHTFLWWLDGDSSLSKKVRRLIEDEENKINVSAASAWEISTKVRIGKLPGAVEIAQNISWCINSQGFLPLSISVAHAQQAGLFALPHRDPFDRVLAAQCFSENLTILSSDEIFDNFGVTRIWK